MPTAIAIIEVIAGIDFAAVYIRGVAVLPRVGAVCDFTYSIEASGRAVCNAASDGTRAAGSHIGVQIGFASVAVIGVTVVKPRVTTSDAAGRLRAFRSAVLCSTYVSAAITVVIVGSGVDFTAIAGITVAIGKASIA